MEVRFTLVLFFMLMPLSVAAQPRIDTLKTRDSSIMILMSEDNTWSLLRDGRPVPASDLSAVMDIIFPDRKHGLKKSDSGDAESVETFFGVQGESVAYQVKKGDTLSAIARKFGISVEELCRLNSIKKNGILSIGQTIKIR